MTPAAERNDEGKADEDPAAESKGPELQLQEIAYRKDSRLEIIVPPFSSIDRNWEPPLPKEASAGGAWGDIGHQDGAITTDAGPNDTTAAAAAAAADMGRLELATDAEQAVAALMVGDWELAERFLVSLLKP